MINIKSDKLSVSNNKQQQSFPTCNRCRCDSCLFWRKFNENVKSMSRLYINCNLLDHSLTRNEFYTDDDLRQNSIRLINQTENLPVMLDYQDITVDFHDNINDVYFHDNIKVSLKKLGIKTMWRLQYYTWPIVLRMQHLIIVGDSYSGKTFAYLPSVLSLILDLDVDINDVKLNNSIDKMQPRVIIICSSSREVFQLYKFISGFLINNLEFTYILSPLVSHLPSCSSYKCIQLIIGTPEAFQEALNKDLIDFGLLFSCVFETWNLFENNQIQICTDIMMNIKKHVSRAENVNPLLIAVSEIWTNSLKEFTDKYFTNLPVYCIQSGIEACMYAEHKFHLTMLNDSRKMNYVLEIVKKLQTSEKILIISENEEELISLSEFLIHFDILFYLLTSNTDIDEIRIVKSNWDANVYRNSVLLITDEILHMTNIANATLLIHLSIPTLWFTFQYRFTSLIKNSCIRIMPNGKKCKIYIITNENSIKQMYSLSCLLNRLNFDEYCEDYRNLCENIIESIEYMKCDKYQMCSSLISFGECFEDTEYSMCKRCHLFHNDINILNLPNSGIIEFHVLKIRSPTRFFVKLINLIDSDGNIDYVRETFEKVQEQLKDFKHKFNNNRKSIRFLEKNAKVRVGQIYGYILYKNGCMARAKILAIGFKSVDVMLIDAGNELYNVSIDHLFYLSETLERLPCCTIEVNLCNLVPYHLNSEKSYCLHCTHLLIRNLRKFSPLDHFRGKIVFRYQSIYWLDDFELIENGNKKTLSIKDYLIANKIAKNETTLIKILKNANEAIDDKQMIKVVNQNNESEIRTININLKWMELSNNMFDQTKVDVTYVNDISEFYVIINSQKKSIEQLETKLKLLYSEMVQDDQQPNINVNNLYAAQMRNGNVKRVLVLSIQYNIAECFLVDSGFTEFLDISYLRVLDKNLMEELPFQAIKCRLWGVKQKVYRDSSFIFQVKKFSALNYAIDNDIEQHNNLLNMKLHAVLLVTKDMTLNSWLVKEFPDDFQLNPDESFMNFLENDYNDDDCGSDSSSKIACLSSTESEQMKLIEINNAIDSQSDILENSNNNSSSTSEYNSMDFEI